MRKVTFLCLVALVLATNIALAADPFQHPVMVKRSFRHLEWGFGFNLGAGFFATDHDSGVFLENGDYSQDREAGIAGGAFLGYGITRDLVLGAEGQYWGGKFSGELADEHWNLVLGTATLRWYPGSVGLCVKGGFGIAYAAGDLQDQDPDAEFLDDEFHDTTYVLQGGAGWEFRLPFQDAVVTFGPFVEYLYLPMSRDLNGDLFNIKLQLTWHGNDRKLDEYFRH